ncbi:MAG: hypothetical protein L0Z62_44890 [Gemmataceae bacterium]|nr:hypothetical protein [Gemmataceae bacterium]
MARRLPYILTTAFLLLAYWILARSCAYDHRAIWSYLSYLIFYVWAPGHGLLVLTSRERVTWLHSLALGLPLGFACEIGAYLGLSALGLRAWHSWAPVAAGAAMLAGAGWKLTWRQALPGKIQAGRWPVSALAAGGLLVMFTAAAKMYAPAPLWGGLLLHVTHHDWVYLVSRAAEIKHQWPLEDPSMAGTPLSYHYFLMVHVAAASRVTGLEIPLVMLRLAVVPMGIALLAQVFLLGSLVGRSVWAGGLAVFLLYATGEVSGQESSTGGWFQSLFLQWLYVSPTFFFGMVFMGALMLWIHHILASDVRTADYAALLLLSVAATGAKGTTVGPLVAASGLWILWQAGRARRWHGRMAVVAGLLLLGFFVSYALVLRQWSGGGTSIQPFAFIRVSSFWLAHADTWQAHLQTAGLPSGLSSGLAAIACAGATLAGMNGILLIGLMHAFTARARRDDAYATWLGLVAVVCMAFGNLLSLDSNGESYLYLPMRLPLAVLTAAALVALWERCIAFEGLAPARLAAYLRVLGAGLCVGGTGALVWSGTLAWWAGVGLGAVGLFLLAPQGGPGATAGPAFRDRRGFGRFLLRLAPLLPLVAVAAVQCNYFRLSNRSGFKLWGVQAATGRDPALASLHDGLDWVRRNLPVDALLIAGTFTLEKAGPDSVALVDRTTADKHYYYSALGERRLFVEGPAYLRDQAEARKRMRVVAEISRGGVFEVSPVLRRSDCYLLVDREARPVPGDTSRYPAPVFENDRISIHPLGGLLAAAGEEE